MVLEPANDVRAKPLFSKTKPLLALGSSLQDVLESTECSWAGDRGLQSVVQNLIVDERQESDHPAILILRGHGVDADVARIDRELVQQLVLARLLRVDHDEATSLSLEEGVMAPHDVPERELEGPPLSPDVGR